jgi:hypothetical protein
MPRRTILSVRLYNNLVLRLNPDCVALIFDYLSPIDIAQCELVSKLWRDRVHGWIVTFGVRQHWPTMPREGALEDRLSVVKEYKGFGKFTEMKEETLDLIYSVLRGI